MSTGPTATGNVPKHTLCERVRQTSTLVGAWHAIRRNAETSRRLETREEARKFGADLPRNLRRLQDKLRAGYVFAKAFGATPSKGGGKAGKRPLVVAPLPDRIVQRAILDVLQSANDLAPVQMILSTPTSIGGIKGRGVDQAIDLIQTRFEAGDLWAAGSDISGFFTKIRRDKVVDFIAAATGDPAFTALFDAALTVELINSASIDADDRKLFPTGQDGVAQGCPLSALAGNIILREFDAKMNGRGITCVRYIDDFVLLGKSKSSVIKAMNGARDLLAALSMKIYDPIEDPKKAFLNLLKNGPVFLGYRIEPGAYPPAPSACDKLIGRVEAEIAAGKQTIRKALRGSNLTTADKGYAQTLVSVSNIVRGWRGSFSSTVQQDCFRELDQIIDRRISDFDRAYRSAVSGASIDKKRRAMGVALLVDGAGRKTSN